MKVKWPLSLLTRVAAMLVSRLVSVTEEPGITPPDESVTVPTTVPIEDCVNAFPAPANDSNTTNNPRRLVMTPALLECRIGNTL
jgi:hypothetical protein